MKKYIKCMLIIIYISCFCIKMVQATSTDEVMQNQKDALGITDFIEESERYTSEYEDLHINDILTSAISGNIDNKKLFKIVLKTFGKELGSAVTVLGSIIIIIVISIKSIHKNFPFHISFHLG